MSRLLPVVAAGAVAAVLAGCGAGSIPTAKATRPVPAAIVPAQVPGEDLTIQLNTAQETVDAFAKAGPLVLVTDGKVWEIHRGDRLVGALQVSTLKTRVNPAKASDRNAIVNQILAGTTERIDIKGLPVWTLPAKKGARSIFVWFGSDVMGVLQLKGDDVDPEKVASELIGHIAVQPEWQALPPEVYVDRAVENR